MRRPPAPPVRPRAALVAGALLVLGANSSPARAQQAPATISPVDLTPGDRLRAWTPAERGRPVLGTLARADTARLTLLLADSGRYDLAWRDLDSLQVQRGWVGGRGRRGALVGALALGGVLGLLGATLTE